MNDYKQYSPLTPTNFRFEIQDFPTVGYAGQGVNLPSISIGTIESYTQETDIQLPDNKVTYSPLSIPFIVDEDMNNYVALFEWMLDVAHTDGSHLLFAKSATLIIYNRDFKMSRALEFRGLIPISISDLQFSTVDEESVLVCNVTFEYDVFSFMSK